MEVIRHIQIPVEPGEHIVVLPLGATHLGPTAVHEIDGHLMIPVVVNPKMRETQYVITAVFADFDYDSEMWEGIRASDSKHVVLAGHPIEKPGSPGIYGMLYIIEVEGRLKRRQDYN